MSSTVRCKLPAQFAVDGKVLDNPVRQLRRPAQDEVVEVSARGRKADGHALTRADGTACLIVQRRSPIPDEGLELLHSSDFPGSTGGSLGELKGTWLRPTAQDPATLDLAAAQAACREVVHTWRGQFTFREERRDGAGAIVEEGLRPPQTGALYAVLAHWRVSSGPATVVMPTGTGKTETMLSVLAWERLPRLLVIVPTNALREQIGDKFLTFGLLRQLGVLSDTARHPVVGLLEHMPRSPDEVDEVFLRCNVIVTTMHVAGRCSGAVQRRMAEVCSHLFIDEAHHISARTWDGFRQHFTGRPILQFTATPFRNDGKHVDGRIVFNYPLRKAQAEGYFKPITFRPVDEIDRGEADIEIACTALDQLEADLSAGHPHLVMARTSDTARAAEVLKIYQGLAAQHNPVLIHHKTPTAERREALRRLRAGESRIVVCVDMLGEGFDLPELKIAALHDPHKSLAITLQFTGRFTRSKSVLGTATMIANIADPGVDEALRELYAEDADWNILLRELSEGATGRQARRSELLDAFQDVPEEVSLRNIFPKMSAVVYRTNCQRWRPDRFREGMGSAHIYWGPALNEKDRVLLFITCEHEPVPWGAIRHLQNTTWHVYAVHWDEERGLLFINSSNNGTTHEDLAKAVAGDEVSLVKGERVFRSLHGLNRLILTNLGLSHVINQNNRFSMHVGTDISDALPEALRQNKKKSNLFSNGYENGVRVTAGCSQKGRMWSYKIAYDLSEWIEWCHHIGAKLIDDRISTEDVFRNVILPRPLTERPALVPLVVEWPDDFLSRSEDVIQVEIDGEAVPFFEAGLDVLDFTREGPIRFRVAVGTKIADYEVRFTSESVEYEPVRAFEAHVTVGRRRRSLGEWFRQESPIIRFENGAFLEHNELYELPPTAQRQPFDRARIQTLDWSGVDLKKESQKSEKRADSIQRRTLDTILAPAFDPQFEIIFDDDDSGEAADIVCMRVTGNRLVVHFYHCKYSKEASPGARVDDLYAVCGQAQRSVYWRGRVDELLLHLRHRDDMRRKRAEKAGKAFVTRFERGDIKTLQAISRKLPLLRPEFRIFVVQPGISVAKADMAQLELLGVTEAYLAETYAISMGVIASP